ncbi:MAG: ATP-binding protein, partial [bacterium]
RISRELHDGICQQLSCMKLSTEILQDQLRTKDKSINQKLLTLASQCESMIDEIRRMSANLRPSHLDDFGIGVTLEFLAREFRETTGINVELNTDENMGMKLDPQIEIAIYRISQEALSNIAKYADPSDVSISLYRQGDAIVLRIEDDGAGFDLADLNSRPDPEHGLGLLGIRERVALFGGVLVIESAPDKGTSINVTITLGQNADSIPDQKEKAGKFESTQAFQRGGGQP